MKNDPAVHALNFQGPEGQRVAVRQTFRRTVQNSAQHPTAPESVQTTETTCIDAAPHVVFCGGFHSTMQGVKATSLARFCEAQCWSYTRFDYRGHGESDGDANTLTLHDWLDDTLSVLDAIAQPVILVGSSMGGWLASLAAARRSNQVQGLLLLAAAPDFLQELILPKLTTADIWDLQQNLVVQLPSSYDKPYPITRGLLDSGVKLSLLGDNQSELSKLLCPIRLIHGTADSDVPFTLSVRLMDRIEHNDAQLTLLHKADHRLSDDQSLRLIEFTLQELIQTIDDKQHSFNDESLSE